MGNTSAVTLTRLKEVSAVDEVRLLGYGPVPFHIEGGVLSVYLPANLPCEMANCLEIHLR